MLTKAEKYYKMTLYVIKWGDNIMTVIEFFTNSPLENMISCFSLKPEKVIFVGKGTDLHVKVGIFRRVAESMGLNTAITVKPAKCDSVEGIRDALDEIVKNEKDCCFDLTGGDDLALVAMGIVFQQYRGVKDLKMQRFDIKSGQLIDCVTNAKKNAVYTNAALTAKEYIELHGGKIKKSTGFKSDIEGDVERLWSICRKDPVTWNRLINVLGRSRTTHYFPVDSNDAVLDQELGSRIYSDSFIKINAMLRALADSKLIINVKKEANCYYFSYSSDVVKRCLSKAGDVLELFVLLAASMITKDDGSLLYNDYISNVEIDWDGRYGDKSVIDGTMNEIDVFLMKGLLPVFISCKNGDVDENELYKLSTVAERFGGVYGKKVLVLASLNKDENQIKFFMQRAVDMGITVINNVMNNELSKFSERLRDEIKF